MYPKVDISTVAWNAHELHNRKCALRVSDDSYKKEFAMEGLKEAENLSVLEFW